MEALAAEIAKKALALNLSVGQAYIAIAAAALVSGLGSMDEQQTIELLRMAEANYNAEYQRRVCLANGGIPHKA